MARARGGVKVRGSGASSRSSAELAGRGQRNFENYGLRNGKNCKMVMLRSGIFQNL